jgi:hypothetical protein
MLMPILWLDTRNIALTHVFALVVNSIQELAWAAAETQRYLITEENSPIAIQQTMD